MSTHLPHYAKRLDALHRALEDDFRQIVAKAPLGANATLVDAGCGDGFFTGLLSERLPRGVAVALDNSPAYLDAARARLAPAIAAGRCRVLQGNVAALPFEAASLDAVWSAHSMQSYDDISHVLQEFRRVLKPGGVLAVLETDSMHSIMLPWPTQLELAVRQAERLALDDADDRMGAYFPRYASRLFRDAGFKQLKKHHELIHRGGPLDEPLRRYVQMYVDDLVDRTRAHLDASSQSQLDDFAATCARGEEDVYFSSLQVLMTATTTGA